MKNFSLLPREDKFFRLLEKLSAAANAAALLLETYVKSTDAGERSKTLLAISDRKSEAKSILSNVTGELCRSYITPFDREDIQAFSNELYKITKIVEKIGIRLELHGIASEHDDFAPQTDLIVREAQAMEGLVHDLTHGHLGKDIMAKITMLQDLELQGDAILSELLVSLFRETREARDLILRKDIYDMLEKVVDRYRDAAGVALQIVLKHA